MRTTMYAQKPWLRHYEAGVPAQIDYEGQLLHETLDESARTFPNQTAVRMLLRYLPLGIPIQTKLTYRELKEASDRFAAGLSALGVQQGERVAVMLPNIPQMIVAFFGALKAGCTVVNTNPTYTAQELLHLLVDSGATTLVLLSGHYDRFAEVRNQTAVKTVVVTDISDSLAFPFRQLVNRQLQASKLMADVADGAGVIRLNELLSNHPPHPPQIRIGADDVVLFQYTAGTTGVPKAAMLTHKNLASNVLQVRAWLTDVTEGAERTLGAIPFFHVYGMTMAMLLTLDLGSELIVIPDPRQTELILEIIQREKVTIYPGVPTMYIAIINHPKVASYDLHSIKVCVSGAMALPVEVQRAFEDITQGSLVEAYGLTEASPGAIANPIRGVRKPGSIGLPVSSTEAAVVSLEANDDGSFSPVEVGEEGELIIRGPQIMKGYWNAEEETADAIDAEGWLHTGDIARMDDEGSFYIVDRKKDLIIASGYNIVPREVEEVLYQHPAVQEAVVAGVPDARRGETVKAYVILRRGVACTATEIEEFCRERLAPYKVPRLIEFRSELPKSQVGKTLRRVLVEEERKKGPSRA